MVMTQLRISIEEEKLSNKFKVDMYNTWNENTLGGLNKNKLDGKRKRMIYRKEYKYKLYNTKASEKKIKEKWNELPRSVR